MPAHGCGGVSVIAKVRGREHRISVGVRSVERPQRRLKNQQQLRAFLPQRDGLFDLPTITRERPAGISVAADNQISPFGR